MCFAKRNAYLCLHAKLYDFINSANFFMLLRYVLGAEDVVNCVTSDFIISLSKLHFRYDRLIVNLEIEFSFDRYSVFGLKKTFNQTSFLESVKRNYFRSYILVSPKIDNHTNYW